MHSRTKMTMITLGVVSGWGGGGGGGFKGERERERERTTIIEVHSKNMEPSCFSYWKQTLLMLHEAMLQGKVLTKHTSKDYQRRYSIHCRSSNNCSYSCACVCVAGERGWKSTRNLHTEFVLAANLLPVAVETVITTYCSRYLPNHTHSVNKQG